MLRAIALVCLVACDLARPAEAAIPGERWTSATQPWRLETSAAAVAVVGQDAVVGGLNGWVGRVDLGSGQLVHSRSLDFEIYFLAALRDGRVLATGKRGERPTAAVLDATTLLATSIAMPDWWRLSKPTVIPEGVVFAGAEMPLVTYDPKTWKAKRILDTALGWDSALVVGGALLATHDERAYRFELATGRKTELGRGDKIAAGGDAVARRVLEDVSASKMGVEVDWRGKRAFTIEKRFANEMSIDRSGSRLAVYDSNGTLEVFELPSGKSLYKPVQGHGNVMQLVSAGPRFVLAAGRVVRVVDGRDGSITSTGSGPVDQPWSLTVDNAGAVVWSGIERVYSMVGGTVVSELEPGGDTRFAPVRGEVGRFAMGDNHRVVITTIKDRTTFQSWKLNASMSFGWFDRDQIVVETTDGGVRRLVRGDRKGIATVLAFEAAGVVHDVDIRTDRALIGFDGTVWLTSLRDGSRTPVPGPNCKAFTAQLEPGSHRVWAFDDHQIVVRDGATEYSTRFDEEIYRAEHVPGRDELVIALKHRVVLWSPGARTVRELAVGGVTTLAFSPDGRKVAFALADTRTVVADLDVMRAALAGSETRAKSIATPRCPVAPFAAIKD